MNKKKVFQLAVEFILTRDIPELATLTPETLASHLGVGLPLLAQAFQKEQQLSVTGFILREKMHRAATLLEEADNPLIDPLSHSLGFPNTEAFIAEFEDYLMIAPARYWELKHKENTD